MRESTWQRMKETVAALLTKTKLKDIYYHHHRNLDAIDKFSKEEVRKYFSKIRKNRPPRASKKKSEPVKETPDQELDAQAVEGI